jgi:superfamily II DNA/RNA helicase
MGFCRTNLFKRLESSGQAFVQSIERHILRNYVFLHAIEGAHPLPIGAQDAEMLDARIYDEDVETTRVTASMFEDEDNDEKTEPGQKTSLRTEADFKNRAAEIYEEYATEYKRRFKWLSPGLFVKSLAKDLQNDAEALLKVLHICGEWDSNSDAKLQALVHLITKQHPDEKIIVFTQFADTVRYLENQLKEKGVAALSGVTGGSANPTALAWKFSPDSNNKRTSIKPAEELRVLIATDVLSEGQNLQDGAIVVNYDLPWAIIRLVQRAGRIDRIGQKAENILCYSFLPADGVERILRLRARVRRRLQENAEVVGTDEAFFEDDRNDQAVLDLYNEKAGIFDGEADTEVDLASYAYQIWKNAITADPSLQKVISGLQPVIYSTRAHKSTEKQPEGVLVYLRTAEGNDALAWVDHDGRAVTESQFAILQAAACRADTPAMPRRDNHHELVQKGVELIVKEEKSIGGQLGRPSSARFRTYERLKRYAEHVKGTLFDTHELHKAINEIYRYPLRPSAVDTLNRQLRSGVSDEALVELVMALRGEDRLCLVHEEEQVQEPRIICSMGLKEGS